MSPTNSDTAAQSRNESQPTTLLEIKTASFQDIWEKDINAEKLVALLRRKFGANGYELYVRRVPKSSFDYTKYGH